MKKLPVIIGFSASLVLSSLYFIFLIIIGVAFMISIIKKHDFYSQSSTFGKLMRVNLKYVVIVLFITGFMTVTTTTLKANSSNTIFETEMEAQILEENRVTFKVKPEYELNGTIDFYISMNTHSVNLDFNMKQIALLIDSDGNEISPLSWSGDSEGGHHRSGYLIFPFYSDEITSLRLSLSPGERFEELTFIWDLSK